MFWKAASNVRVNAQLIDTRTNAHLWAETYDRDLADVFAIQSDIAQQIAGQLKAKLSANEKFAIEERPTKDLAAYDLYVRAKLLITAADPEKLREAARLLDQAIARDPEFFLPTAEWQRGTASFIRSSITLQRDASWPRRRLRLPLLCGLKQGSASRAGRIPLPLQSRLRQRPRGTRPRRAHAT